MPPRIPYAMIPVGFDPSPMLAHSRRRCGDRARYLVSVIAHKTRKDAWARLSTRYLQRFIPHKHAAGLIRDLVKAGVIVVRKDAIKGTRPFGYRLSDRWHCRDLTRYELNDGYLVRKIWDWWERLDMTKDCPERVFLRQSLQRLDIDREHAMRIISGLNLSESARDIALADVADIERQQWFFTTDRWGRCHHNVTKLKRELRESLRVSGEPLVEIDVVNCQPILVPLVAKAWIEDRELFRRDSLVTASACSRERQTQRLNFGGSEEGRERENHITTPCFNFVEPAFNKIEVELNEYVATCEAGRFYETLAGMVGREFRDAESRASFKREVFSRLLFADLYAMQGKLAQAFAEMFPTIFQMLVEAHVGKKSRLPRHMQSLESGIVIDGAVREFRESRPRAFALTIHDSILVRKQDAEHAKSCLRNAFASVGLRPRLSVKHR